MGELLPRAEERENLGDELQFDGAGWLMSVFPPEEVDANEVPAEISETLGGLSFRVELGVEPSNPPAEAWAFVREVLASVSTGFGGGAAVDPETGRTTSWP